MLIGLWSTNTIYKYKKTRCNSWLMQIMHYSVWVNWPNSSSRKFFLHEWEFVQLMQNDFWNPKLKNALIGQFIINAICKMFFWILAKKYDVLGLKCMLHILHLAMVSRYTKNHAKTWEIYSHPSRVDLFYPQQTPF